METSLPFFEGIARRAYKFTKAGPVSERHQHPFATRNVHEAISTVSLKLFDDGHYSQSAFEAYKLIDKVVQKASKSSESGVKLMMTSMGGENPLLCLTPMNSTSEKDEQTGYKFLFSGTVSAIRNPRAHEVLVKDDIDLCLDHLSLASFLARKLDSITEFGI